MMKFNATICLIMIAYAIPAMAQISAIPSKPIVPTSITGGEENKGKKYKPKPTKSADTKQDNDQTDPPPTPDLDTKDTKADTDMPSPKDIPLPNFDPDAPLPDLDDL